MIKFTKRKVLGDTVHLSEGVLLPYSTVKQSNIKVEKYVIIRNKSTGVFEVGVWDTVLSKYNTQILSDCNTKKLNETISKLQKKIKLGR